MLQQMYVMEADDILLGTCKLTIVASATNMCQPKDSIFTYFRVGQSVTRLHRYHGRCSVEDTVAALEDRVEGAWYEQISCAQLQTLLGTWQLEQELRLLRPAQFKKEF